MNRFTAFVLGMREFRSDFTTNPGNMIYAYDSGREFAHWITLRRFEVQS